METPTYWHRQTAEKPYFDKLLWNKPETRAHAGKILIIGGNKFSLTAPGIAFAAASKAGVGTARVLLPEAVRKTIGKTFDEGEFAPSNPSGSFSSKALAQFVDESQWADLVMLAGDFGRNSETAILLDEFLMRYGGPVVLTGDTLHYFMGSPRKLLCRPNTLIVLSLSQLQKLAQAWQPPVLIKHSLSLHALVGVLNGWTRENRSMILTYQPKYYVLALDELVSTTPAEEKPDWQVPLAANSAVWWAQQPNQPFEAITTAIYDFAH
jgi:hypothetical protein